MVVPSQLVCHTPKSMFFLAIMPIIRGIITIFTIVKEVKDEISRERAKEQAKLAPVRKKMADAYKKASNQAGKEQK